MIQSLPNIKDGTCPVERFSGVEVAPNLKANHNFGRPVYALNEKLAAGKSIPKWDSRAKASLYLGSSPRHSRNGALMLSSDTGIVSPYAHARHDDFFKTVSPKAGNPAVLSHWQKLSGLRLDDQPNNPRPKSKLRSNPVTNEKGVVSTVAAEPDLYELEEETPPCFGGRRYASFGRGT
jgi:hypothetical protein